MVVAPIEFAVYLSLFMGMAWHMVAQACEAACLLFKAFDAFTGKGYKGKVYASAAATSKGYGGFGF